MSLCHSISNPRDIEQRLLFGELVYTACATLSLAISQGTRALILSLHLAVVDVLQTRLADN